MPMLSVYGWRNCALPLRARRYRWLCCIIPGALRQLSNRDTRRYSNSLVYFWNAHARTSVPFWSVERRMTASNGGKPATYSAHKACCCQIQVAGRSGTLSHVGNRNRRPGRRTIQPAKHSQRAICCATADWPVAMASAETSPGQAGYGTLVQGSAISADTPPVRVHAFE